MRRYRVVVDAEEGTAHVKLKRRWAVAYSAYISVAKIRLDSDDADEKLTDARARATALAHQVNGLEKDRP